MLLLIYFHHKLNFNKHLSGSCVHACDLFWLCVCKYAHMCTWGLSQGPSYARQVLYFWATSPAWPLEAGKRFALQVFPRKAHSPVKCDGLTQIEAESHFQPGSVQVSPPHTRKHNGLRVTSHSQPISSSSPPPRSLKFLAVFSPGTEISICLILPPMLV